MKFTIKNKFISAEINSLGAELVSCIDVIDNYQYIYQTTPLWLGQAKNLFPNIGQIKDNYIYVRGEKYLLGQHGFAKDMEFAVTIERKDEVEFVLHSDENTKKHIPYNFDLFVKFQLQNNAIRQRFRVVNLDDSTMFFGLGSHTGFIALENSYLDFGNNGSLLLIEREDMMFLTGKCKTYNINCGVLNIQKNSYNHGADILTGFNKHEITLRNSCSSRSVTVNFTGFQYLGIWAPSDSQIAVSIMPWCALPDEKNTSHNFEEKVGNVRLNGKDTFEVSQILTFGK